MSSPRKPNFWEDLLFLGIGLILLGGLVMGLVKSCESINRERAKACYEKTRDEGCWK